MVGNHNVFMAAAAGVRRLSFALSASVYGSPTGYRCTRTTGQTADLTASASEPGEDPLGFTREAEASSRVALRFFNVYGPGQKTSAYHTSVINHLSNRLSGELPIVDGRGEQSMDFVHVHAWARAVVMALSRRVTTWRSTGTGVQTSLAQLARDRDRCGGCRRGATAPPPDVLCDPAGGG